MAESTTETQIPKIRDGDIINKFAEVFKTSGCKNLCISCGEWSNEIPIDNLSTIHEIIDANSYCITRCYASVPNIGTFYFYRDSSRFYDIIKYDIAHPNNKINFTFFEINKAFIDSFCGILPDAVSDSSHQAIEELPLALQRFVSQLSESTSRNFDQISQKHKDFIDDYDVRTKKLHDAVESERAKLTQDYEQRNNEVETKKKELESKEAAMRLKENTSVRREIYDTFKSKVEGRTSNLKASPQTNFRWRLVFTAYSFVLLITGIFAYTALTDLFGASQGINYPLAVKAFFSSVLFSGFLIAFLHWVVNDHKTTQREEMELRRLGLDFDRANWLIEIALEYEKATGGRERLPSDLLEIVSRNLFIRDQEKKCSDDSLGILKHALGIKVTPQGVEAQFDRKAIKEMAKDNLQG